MGSKSNIGITLTGLGVVATAIWLGSTSTVTEIIPEEPAAPEITEENRAAVRASFEDAREQSILASTERLADIKEKSLDGEGRIVFASDDKNTIAIYEKPPVIENNDFDIEENINPALKMVVEQEPEALKLTGNDFERSLYNVLNVSGLDLWYVPSSNITYKEEPIATYDVNSDRVCQPIPPLLPQWQEKAEKAFDCFPATSLSQDAPLQKDVQTIKQALATSTPQP